MLDFEVFDGRAAPPRSGQRKKNADQGRGGDGRRRCRKLVRLWRNRRAGREGRHPDRGTEASHHRQPAIGGGERRYYMLRRKKMCRQRTGCRKQTRNALKRVRYRNDPPAPGRRDGSWKIGNHVPERVRLRQRRRVPKKPREQAGRTTMTAMSSPLASDAVLSAPTC
jgi:hypothetical protein